MRKLIIGTLICLCFIANNAFALDKWVKAESKHFTVYANITQRDTLAFVKKLEQFRYVLGIYNGQQNTDEEIVSKFEIFLVKDQASFKLVSPGISKDVAGFVKACETGIIGYSSFSDESIEETKSVKDQAYNQSLDIMFHEYTHIFMFQIANSFYPEWFVEGYAEFFGPTKITGVQAVVGSISPGRYYTLSIPGNEIPYKDILKVTPEVKKDSEKVFSFYAQSWLLTHYMLSTSSRRKQLSQYLKEVNNGAEEVEAFERTTSIKIKNLSQILRKYMDNELSSSLITLSQMPLPNISITEMPKSSDKLMLMNAAAVNCPHTEYQPKLLSMIKDEAAKYPNDEYAKMSVANADIYIGPEEKSLPFYKEYVLKNPNDAKGMFHLGLTYYLMAKHDKFDGKESYKSQINLARKYFSLAYKLNPADFVNLYYLSQTGNNSGGKPDESSYNAALEAFLSAPTITAYAYNALYFQLNNNDLEDALNTMEIISGNPHLDEGNRSNLKNAINAIKEKKPIEKIFEALNASNLPKVE